MLSNQTLSPFFVFYGTATLFLEIFYSLVTSAKREAILFLFGCSEVNSTWLITSELANQRARKTLFTCVVYIEDITWPRVDTNFIFECSTRYLTSERSIIKYRSYAHSYFSREIEKISSVYLYSECYSNKAYKILLKRASLSFKMCN